MGKFANVDVSLDDIIAKTRKAPIGKRRGPGGPGGRRHNDSKRSSLGRAGGWKDLDAQDAPSVAPGGNKKVRVNISNLAPTVVSADLEELFEEFDYDSVVVNYNENGVSLGTGDIVLRKRDAEALISKFRNIALDQKEMKFAIVDGGNSIKSRIEFTGRRSGGDSRGFGNFKRSAGFGRRRGGGGKAGNPEDFLRDGVHEGEIAPRRGGGGKKAGGGGGRREKKPQKTTEELDAELDAYMSKKA